MKGFSALELTLEAVLSLVTGSYFNNWDQKHLLDRVTTCSVTDSRVDGIGIDQFYIQ